MVFLNFHFLSSKLCIKERSHPYDRSGIYTKLPIPQRFQCDQMQSFADILNGCSDGMAATIQDGCRIQHALDVIIRSAEEEKWLPCD